MIFRVRGTIHVSLHPGIKVLRIDRIPMIRGNRIFVKIIASWHLKVSCRLSAHK